MLAHAEAVSAHLGRDDDQILLAVHVAVEEHLLHMYKGHNVTLTMHGKCLCVHLVESDVLKVEGSARLSFNVDRNVHLDVPRHLRTFLCPLLCGKK